MGQLFYTLLGLKYNHYAFKPFNYQRITPPKNKKEDKNNPKSQAQAMATISPLLILPKSLLNSQIHSKPTSKIPTLTKPLNRFRLSFPLASTPPNPNPFSTAAAASSSASSADEELIFFDGGAHYGDLVANLLLGFTLLWLPLTIAAVSRAFFLRYRFTNRRVTVISGFTGGDRTDFPYSAVTDVQVVPRLIGEWGDIVISLKDGTKVDLRSVPKFREIADYCLLMKEEESQKKGGRAGDRRGF